MLGDFLCQGKKSSKFSHRILAFPSFFSISLSHGGGRIDLTSHIQEGSKATKCPQLTGAV
jgi:hypothetical protein